MLELYFGIVFLNGFRDSISVLYFGMDFGIVFRNGFRNCISELYFVESLFVGRTDEFFLPLNPDHLKIWQGFTKFKFIFEYVTELL